MICRRLRKGWPIRRAPAGRDESAEWREFFCCTREGSSTEDTKCARILQPPPQDRVSNLSPAGRPCSIGQVGKLVLWNATPFDGPRRMTITRVGALVGLVLTPAVVAAAPLPGFRPSAMFDEQVHERWLEGNIRVIVNAAGDHDPSRPSRLAIYATPNGNSIEQTLGCEKVEGLDWHFDIQHVAAQIRRLRELTKDENVVLACLEAEGLSWPAWRRATANSSARIRSIVEGLRQLVPGVPVRVTLTGHSGGGSFIFGFLNSADAIPDYIERIAFLDANYAYSDDEKHGDKLLAWLNGGAGRRLSVVAYDD